MHLSRFKRLHFAHLPTPLEPLTRLSQHLGGPNIWIKRDDCTGLSTGGNKTRKLEFLMADAVDQKATVILTQGATQSNHARQTAAAAAKYGMKCHLLLEDRTRDERTEYKNSGNVLLDNLHGAAISRYLGGTDMEQEMHTLARQLQDDGETPYIIPGGGSNELGALGYVSAALEILTQANNRGLVIDRIVHATGSCGTQAGLVSGFIGTNAGINVLGIGVRAPKSEQERKVLELTEKVCDYVGIPRNIDEALVAANCDYVGPGYGVATESMKEAVRLLARTDGILLDPVYSGKAMAGLIDLIRRGIFKPGENIVFLHTGGSAGLFGYREILTDQAPTDT